MDIFKEILKPIFWGIVVTFCIAGILLFCHIDEFVQEVQYYQNDVKVDAIEYHNEIYLKKGE